MSTEMVAPVTDVAAGVDITSEDVKTFVGLYLSRNYAQRQLDRMCATTASRELAAMEVFPDPRASTTERQRELAKYMKRHFSPNLGCWRSLLREVLADRQLKRDAKVVSA